MRFKDRSDAGRQLGVALQALRPARPIVLAIPRGGVPVAAEAARALGASLDVVLAHKLGAPGHPELAIGAIVSAGARILDEGAIEDLGITGEYLAAETARQHQALEARLRRLRMGRPAPDLTGRTVIVVDDGAATGHTLCAALQALRKAGPGRLVAAVPVAPAATISRLAAAADDVVCLTTPEPFVAVGEWYGDFSQTTEEEVVRLLDAGRAG